MLKLTIPQVRYPNRMRQSTKQRLAAKSQSQALHQDVRESMHVEQASLPPLSLLSEVFEEPRRTFDHGVFPRRWPY